MAGGRKQIAFDLDTNYLKIYYPTEHWNHAYRDMKRFMTNNGFKWEQGSVYTSNSARSPHEIRTIITAMVNEYPWLNVCMRDCVVTNIGRSHSQNYLFDSDAKIPPREKSMESDQVMDILTDVVSAADPSFRDDEQEKEFHPELDR